MARGGEKHSPTRFCQSPFLRVRSLSYRFDSRIDSFWARALHKDVFPVPGGPNMDTNIDTQYKSYRFYTLISKSFILSYYIIISYLLLYSCLKLSRSCFCYHEAEQLGSMRSGCCPRFCQRSKLWLRRNPRARGEKRKTTGWRSNNYIHVVPLTSLYNTPIITQGY